jgi:trehalose 6-phosphate phosphatase
VNGIDDLWPLLRTERPKLLALDYDGTLAPFSPDRMKAFPLPGVTELVRTIRAQPRTEVAILTGRAAGEIPLLAGDLGVTIVGQHGWEILRPGAAAALFIPEPVQLEGLIRARSSANELGLAALVEEKVPGLALHTRGIAPDETRAVESLVEGSWARIAAAHDMACEWFDGGVELRCPQRNKGTALGLLIDDQPPGAVCVYIGDDVTDEDAFLRIRSVGLGIKVGDSGVPTAAAARLEDGAAVRAFLETWIEVVEFSRNG